MSSGSFKEIYVYSENLERGLNERGKGKFNDREKGQVKDIRED